MNGRDHRSLEARDPEKLCAAVLPSGRRCGAYALREDRFCFRHSERTVQERAAASRKGGRTTKRLYAPPPPPVPPDLPPLDPADPAKVMNYRLSVLQHLSGGTIEPNVARLLLDGAGAVRRDWEQAHQRDEYAEFTRTMGQWFTQSLRQENPAPLPVIENSGQEEADGSGLAMDEDRGIGTGASDNEDCRGA